MLSSSSLYKQSNQYLFQSNRTGYSSHASMESTLLIILLSALSLVSSQSQYVPDRYFINCGSNSDTDFTRKTFTGDENPTTFSLSGGQAQGRIYRGPRGSLRYRLVGKFLTFLIRHGHKAVNNNPTSEIYRTARVFSKKSWYELEADGNNTFVIVNLHFSPFVYNGIELSTSKFDVLVSGYTLLSDFNVGNSTVIKEFIIPIGLERKFRIQFIPSSGSSPAFVNAIEAFTTPSQLFKHGVPTPHISPLGKTVYRINVGGQSIDVNHDTLRRNWISDDPFISNIDAAENTTFSDTINYGQGWAARYDAPDAVYNTAQQSSVNITWNFRVNKNAMYLVRAHFCDIVSKAFMSSDDAFNFFIYRNYKEVINPGHKVRALCWYSKCHSNVNRKMINQLLGAIFWVYIDKLKGTLKQTKLAERKN
ncbi:putative non-specific serine/threonine protein kinase [Helianthus debilis subsp. tardiflorus]